MFKKILALVVISSMLGAEAGAQQAMPARGQVKVDRGTVLKFATLQPLDSTTANVGDDVPLCLVDPLVLDGVTLLPAGEVVHGRVKKVKRAGPNGRNGEVDWEVKRIPFADKTTAKAQVGYIDGLTNWDVFGLLVIMSPVLPFVLLDALFDPPRSKEPKVTTPKPSTPGHEFFLPANSEVIVSIKKDHHVRY